MPRSVFYCLFATLEMKFAKKKNTQWRGKVLNLKLNLKLHLCCCLIKEETSMTISAPFLLLDDIWTPLTVLATRETLYLLKEDHQWTKGSTNESTGESKEASSGSVTVLETQPISCVSSVHLWPSDQCRVDIQLYDEVSARFLVLQTNSLSCVWYYLVWFPLCGVVFAPQTVKQEKTWCVHSESSELLQGLLTWVRAQWEAMFGVKLDTRVQDKAA